MPTPDDEARTLIDNERAKLSAAYTNGMAIAVAVVGGLSPILTGGLSDVTAAGFLQSVGKATVCFTASGLLHLLARRLLKGLR